MTDTNSEPASHLPSDDELYAHIDAEAQTLPSTANAHVVTGGTAILSKLPTTVSALAPDERGPILAALAGVPSELRAAKEAELVQQRWSELALNARAKYGSAAEGNAVQREQRQIAYDVADYQRQAAQIEERLSATIGRDPETGVPILSFPMGSHPRKMVEFELNMLRGKINDLIEGPGGQRRIAAAREKAFGQLKSRLIDAHVATEGKRQGEATIINERIQHIARGHASQVRNSL